MGRYLNENDPYAAEWLGNLWPDATVDARSIRDVQPADLVGYERCHFFAGIGGWEYALDLAGWSSPIWTGSCPCQPFSAAGKRQAEADERHLWPAFRALIAECRPPTVVGEQVASKLGRRWLAGVFADLEGMGYAVAGADLCAAGVGAPHIRQRLYWVGHTAGHEQRQSRPSEARHESQEPAGGSVLLSRLAHADQQRRTGIDTLLRQEATGRHAAHLPETAWSRSTLIPCADGKFRRVPATEAGEPQPELFPLAHGVSGRVGKLRAYGNAIVPQVAAAFVRAFMEATDLGLSRAVA